MQILHWNELQGHKSRVFDPGLLTPGELQASWTRLPC